MTEIALVISVFGLALDHHGEAVVEAELVHIGDIALFLQGLGHAAEAELEHAVDIGLCEHTERACPKCETGLPVRSGNAFRCRDCGASIEACPACDGWLDMRMGRFGRFLGCSNYPACDYTRNLRQSRTGAGQPPDRSGTGQRRRR